MEEQFRLANVQDSEAVFLLYKKAIRQMRTQNIDQWDEVYPDRVLLQCDIEKKQMYLLIQNGEIASAVVLNEEQDDQYAQGEWMYPAGRIAVIHRLCVRPELQNSGVGRKTLLLAERVLAQAGYLVIRLDAFSANEKALHLYESLGYKRSGSVLFRKGQFFLYEKPILME